MYKSRQPLCTKKRTDEEESYLEWNAVNIITKREASDFYLDNDPFLNKEREIKIDETDKITIFRLDGEIKALAVLKMKLKILPLTYYLVTEIFVKEKKYLEDIAKKLLDFSSYHNAKLYYNHPEEFKWHDIFKDSKLRLIVKDYDYYDEGHLESLIKYFATYNQYSWYITWFNSNLD